VTTHRQEGEAFSRSDSIAVVGATCPLGKNLVNSLLAAGFSVHGFYRSRQKVPSVWREHPSFQGSEFDLTQTAALAKTLETSQRIIWLAQCRDTLTRTFGQDLNALALEAVCTRSVHVYRKIVLLSSGGSVYGNPNSLPVSEDHPCQPLSKYGESKREMEEVLCANVGRIAGLSGAVLRCGNIYGQTYLAPDAMGCIGAFTRAVMARRPVTLIAGGLAVRDFVHVDDVSQAILSAISCDHRFAVWNVGSGVGTQIIRVLEMICEILDCSPVDLLDVDARSGDVNDIVLNISRIERDCSWRPKINLPQGLKSMLTPFRGLESLPMTDQHLSTPSTCGQIEAPKKLTASD
jgi:UDP-glucose 4-epimerase